MSRRSGSTSTLLSSAPSSTHQPRELTGSRRDVPHRRLTASQAFLNSLRPSPYATTVAAKTPSKSQRQSLAWPLKPANTAPASPGQTHHVRSLSASGRSASGRTVVASHKTREDLIDEVAESRKASRAFQHEKSLLSGRVRHLEEELTKKDKRIASFLETGHVEQQHAVRTRGAAASKAENMTMLMVLKRKVHALETALRQKDSELSQLKMDVKTTSLDELQIKVDTFQEEVLHLRHVLKRREEARREKSAKVRALSDSLKQLEGDNEELHQENEKLTAALKEERLSRRTGRLQTSGIAAGEPSDKQVKGVTERFADSNRKEMVDHVSRIELKNDELNHKLQQVNQENLATLSELKAVRQRHRDLKDQSERIEQLEEQCEKLRSVLTRIKEDRTHYHKLADEKEELANTQAKEISSLGEREQQLAGNVGELQALQAKEELARKHARERQRRKAKKLPSGVEKDAHRQEAAALLQHQWRKRQSKVRQEKHDQVRGSAVTDLQAVLRGHMNRSSNLAGRQQPSSSSDEEDGEEDDEAA